LKNKYSRIVSPTSCPPADLFYEYIDQKLSNEEIHQFERHLNDCPFCNEALEGYKQLDKNEVLTAINAIHAVIDEQAAVKFPIRYMLVAATLVLGLFLGTLYFLMQSSQHSTQLSLTQNEKAFPIENDEPVLREAEITLENETIEEEPVNENTSSKTDIKPVSKSPSKKSNEEEEFDEMVTVSDMDYEIKEEPISKSESTTKMIRPVEQPPSAGVSMMNSAGLAYENSTTTSSLDVSQMLVFAEKQLAKLYQNNNLADDSEYPSHNKSQIYEQYNLLVNSEFFAGYTSLETMLNKDIWNHEEKSTLQWLMAVAAIKLGNNIKAKELLSALQKSENPYTDEAKNWLNKL